MDFAIRLRHRINAERSIGRYASTFSFNEWLPPPISIRTFASQRRTPAPASQLDGEQESAAHSPPPRSGEPTPPWRPEHRDRSERSRCGPIERLRTQCSEARQDTRLRHYPYRL